MAAIGLQGFKLCVPRMNKGVPFRVSWLLVGAFMGVIQLRGAFLCLLKPTWREFRFKGCPFWVPRVLVGVLMGIWQMRFQDCVDAVGR